VKFYDMTTILTEPVYSTWMLQYINFMATRQKQKI